MATWISTICSIISVIVSIIALFKSNKASTISSEAITISNKASTISSEAITISNNVKNEVYQLSQKYGGTEITGNHISECGIGIKT